MSYTAEISRANPSCFIFLLDRSSSMEDPIGGETGAPKRDVVADAMNRLLAELAIKCAKEEGVRDYFHVAVVGYGGNDVSSVFGGALAGRELVPISVVAENPLRLEERMRKESDGAGGVIELATKFPIWVEPTASGGTPMCKALAKARVLAMDWVAEHPRCFPPITLNLTDGEATDGDPVAPADELRACASDDGHVLLFNLHISGSAGAPVAFPGTDTELPDPFARMLFGMSSVLPPYMQSYAKQNGYQVNNASRGFVYNADIVSLVQFLDIGTRALALR